MSDVVISVEELSKKYILGAQSQPQRYLALRDVIAGAFKAPKKSKLETKAPEKEFMALQNVSFDVRRGEALGIIGRNGAGKSTLLKILSRITEPTSGRAVIKGRLASLLEVGTGFHPELSGRENIFLNGAILGMSRAEVIRKFDEIVAFAEVERFLDTPVKRYSSGMYVRLAFAIAAHIDPEILIVDEVLAVGDAQFQKKCLGKMGEVAGEGRTVLFVSHNMAAVGALCRTAILLKDGRIVEQGSIAATLSFYNREVAGDNSYCRSVSDHEELALISAVARYEPDLTSGASRLRLEIRVWARKALRGGIDIRFKDGFGNPVALTSVGGLGNGFVSFAEGEATYIVHVNTSDLAKGEYRLSLDLTEPCVRYIERVEDCLSVSIDPPITGLGTRVLEQTWGYGATLLHSELTT
jgi:lipopolysaccharide transport system ATP-binding protein